MPLGRPKERLAEWSVTAGLQSSTWHPTHLKRAVLLISKEGVVQCIDAVALLELQGGRRMSCSGRPTPCPACVLCSSGYGMQWGCPSCRQSSPALASRRLGHCARNPTHSLAWQRTAQLTIGDTCGNWCATNACSLQDRHKAEDKSIDSNVQLSIWTQLTLELPGSSTVPATSPPGTCPAPHLIRPKLLAVLMGMHEADTLITPSCQKQQHCSRPLAAL